ncbi:MAG: DUF1761 domain-containing protein [Bacteroidetes bacterium]|nr:DUF1761 domain-containing protein [Bacteroidota bacterium]
MDFKINILAVLVAVVANFILGSIWYMPLFGKVWGKEMGYDPNMKPDKKVMMKGMAFMVIGNFLFAWVLAWTMAGWQFIPGANEMGPLVNALNSAIFLWLGFYVPGNLTNTVWEKKSWKLFGINAGYQLASLLVVAFILSYWK